MSESSKLRLGVEISMAAFTPFGVTLTFDHIYRPEPAPAQQEADHA